MNNEGGRATPFNDKDTAILLDQEESSKLYKFMSFMKTASQHIV